VTQIPQNDQTAESRLVCGIRRIVRPAMGERTFMVLTAVVIGILGGFGAVFFRLAIRTFQRVFFGSWNYTLDYVLGLPWYVKLGAPAAGALIVGPIVSYFARETRGHGVPEVIEAVVIRRGVIRPRVMFAKVIASAVCIGSGGSAGREGPIVQIGSSLGSSLGQLFKVSGTRLKTMVACGTAAGIAGTFNAPIAGAIFAMEIILGDFGIAEFSPIVVSSVAATALSRHFLGNHPAFVVPQYELVSVFEMIPYVILGFGAAFCALAFIELLYKTEDLFEKVPLPLFMRPVLGGLMIGLIGIYFPHVFGVGYETITLALQNQLAWYVLLLVIVLKIMATSITLGSGGSGGIFAPSLFIGAGLGGLVGSAAHTLFPQMTASPGAYALVGMGAVAAGAMHAPMTAILILFELTGDYRIMLPLMISCIISVLLTTRLKRESIYTMKLHRRGINVVHGREVNVLRSLKVEQAMKRDYETVPADAPLHELVNLTVNSPRPNFFVVDDDGCPLGVISVHDIRRIIFESDKLESLLVAYDLQVPISRRFVQSDTLDKVMKAFGEMNLDIDELPVVQEGDKKRLIGTVRKNDIIEIYSREVSKRDTGPR
jgi:CIC family chloride channel protein